MSETFTFSPLLSRYLRDSRIRSTVQSLTGKTMSKGFDADLNWSDYPGYVDAWLGAQQVVAEWNKAAFGLWDEIWTPAFEGEIPYTERWLADETFVASGLQECWQDGWIGRHVTIHAQMVQLCLYIDTDEAWVGIEFPGKVTLAKAKALGLQAWSRDDDDLDSDGVSFDTEGTDGLVRLDLTALRGYARDAVSGLKASEPA